MLNRKITDVLLARLEAYPAVALIGPRQCGKTTLARSLGGRYFDLEQDSDRLRLDVQWNEIIAGAELVVLDEAHVWPDLFSRLRGAIDSNRKQYGRFLILGSVSPFLMTRVSESLAGRLSIIELSPFVQPELANSTQQDILWLCGGYPDGGVLSGQGFPVWQMDYLNLLSQRDLPNWGMTAQPQTTLRLLRMLAANHGQEWNASQVGKSLGLSYHTVNGYLDYLEGAFLIRRLPAYYANIRKRLVKRPKIYWRDSGLLHALLNVQNSDDLLNQPWVGASWEGFVIEQVLAILQTKGVNYEAFHLRTNDQREIDLLIRIHTELWAVEIKLTSNPSPSDMARLNSNADLIGADKRFLVCMCSEDIVSGNQVICNMDGIVTFIEQF